MRSGTIAFLLGILLFTQWRAMPPYPATLLLLLPGLFVFHSSRLVQLPAFAIIGFVWALFRAEFILHNELEHELEGQTLHAIGRIVSLPEVNTQRIRFEFAIDELRDSTGNPRLSPGKARLNWYRTHEKPEPGQVWQLTVRLKRPHGFMNPGGFDYERWLFVKRIRATGYVVNNRNNLHTGEYHGQVMNRLRYRLRRQLAALMPDSKQLDLITALSLGDRSLIAPDRMNNLIRTGTSHLLAISGLHIGLVAMLIYALIRRLWSVAWRLPLYLSSPRAAAGAAIVSACAYALLAGFTIPTQRALVMVCIFLLSLNTARRYPFSVVLFTALLAVLLLDPFAVMDPGFWLSFGAVGIITYGMGCRFGPQTAFWRWGRVQVLVAVGLVPLLLAWFQQFSLVGIPANLLAVPWVGLLVVPLILSGILIMPFSPVITDILLSFADRFLGLLWPFLELLADSRLAVWQLPSPSAWLLLISLAGVLILLQPGGIPGRWLGIYWLLPLLFPSQPRPIEGSVWFTLLDVGQGLAAVIETRNHTLIYDTGARFSERFNAGDAVVVPFLMQRGVRKPDLLLISHGDNDHIGGSRAVLDAFPGTPVLTSVPSQLAGYTHRTCKQAQRWIWDGIRFSVLHPPDNGSFRGNNRSCVLRVTTGQHTLLITGDIEKQAELHLLQQYTDELSADVLVVPHHGSKTSSTPAFIRAVNPEWALIGAGYRNRFNLPNQDIILRYQQNDSMVLDTVRHGAINIRIRQPGVVVDSYRQTARRFWHSY